ncbi:MAG TPA: hypothetical protein VIG49_06320 [Acetobacteraceae bacterium]|jgi:hypothetical protein
MTSLDTSVFTHGGTVSPLILSDRLIALAKDADRAGFTGTAEQLVTLACTVFDEAPRVAH